MSGIYVKVTMPELAARLFQSAPYQSFVEINETRNTQILKSMQQKKSTLNFYTNFF